MRHATVLGVLAAALAMIVAPCFAVDEIERPPIEYSASTPDNPVSKLQASLADDETRLEHHEEWGYLPALLAALDVPVESQMLVFSKTSLQRHRISPGTPRAVYFNDDVYVGYCRSGEVLEISAVDPQLGAVFYTLDQKESKRPRLVRQSENCLICHSSSRLEGIPGHLVRSLFVDSSGFPILSEGSYAVDHSTPFEHRWGGWYVTGTHGSQQHLGNLIVRGNEVPRPVENGQGQNVTQLNDRLPVEKYLTPHSDIVALMVLEHQTLVHNRLTKANFVTRQALHYEQELNRALGAPADKRLDSTTRRIQGAGDDLVEALLFVGETKLTEPINGTSEYARKFSQAAPHDGEGRSLRNLDLQRRLFKYPCSYLIYSQSFDDLPVEVRDYVWKQLWEVLSNQNPAPQFAHLSTSDRQAIVEILRATKHDLPGYWADTSRR